MKGEKRTWSRLNLKLGKNLMPFRKFSRVKLFWMINIFFTAWVNYLLMKCWGSRSQLSLNIPIKKWQNYYILIILTQLYFLNGTYILTFFIKMNFQEREGRVNSLCCLSFIKSSIPDANWIYFIKSTSLRTWDIPKALKLPLRL